MEERWECEICDEEMQEAVGVVEDWSLTLGFRMSVAKSYFMMFSRREVKMLGCKYKVRISEFKYLGMWFDERLT
jgi:hypothetical protein